MRSSLPTAMVQYCGDISGTANEFSHPFYTVTTPRVAPNSSTAICRATMGIAALLLCASSSQLHAAHRASSSVAGRHLWHNLDVRVRGGRRHGHRHTRDAYFGGALADSVLGGQDLAIIELSESSTRPNEPASST